MKKLKKLLSIVLAVAMVMSLAVSVGADTTEATTTISIKSYATGTEIYSAYKIFDVTSDGNGNYAYTIDNNNIFFSVIKSLSTSADGYDESNTTTPGYFVLTEVAETDGVKTYSVTQNTTGYSTENADDWANDEGTGVVITGLVATIKAYLKTDSNVSATITFTKSEDSGTDSGGNTYYTYTADVTDPGYYYITTSAGSVVMVDTAEAGATVELTDKNEVPSVEKGVYNGTTAKDDPAVDNGSGSYETNDGTDGTTGDSDAEIGETVYYQTTIDNIYGVSNLVLHDTMTEGLTFNNDVTMYVYTAYSSLSSFTTGTTYYTYDNGVFKKVESEAKPDGITTYYTETKVASTDGGYTVATSTSGTRKDGYCTFEVQIDDIDSLKDSSNGTISVTDGSYLVVEYTATVNSAAVIYDSTTSGSNDNTTYVSYGDASTTAEDKTETYVYPVYIYKYYDESGKTAALSGAVFTIKNEEGKYAVFTYNSSSGVYTLGANIDGTMTYWVSSLGTNSETTYYTLTTPNSGILEIAGLDAETTYTIHEESAPSGYNALSEDLNFYIVGSDATSDKTQGDVYYWNATTGSKESASKNDTVTEITGITTSTTAIPIKNESGSELPSTGGIGVTIFYVVGGILILAAAGVIVVSRKKIKK